MSKTILLRHGRGAAEIAVHGAELRAWSVAACPLIWSPNPAIWADTAPVLFPVVGWTRDGHVTVDGQSYPLGLHGFARGMPFDVDGQGADWVRLVLKDSAQSHALYPFEFTLSVTYRLSGDCLQTALAVHNRGRDAMPYACGLHPGFNWPFVGGRPDDYAIEFATEETPEVPVISAAGLFSRQTRAAPVVGRRLALSETLFAREALCFLDAKSRSLRFRHADGAAITIILDRFPHIALWARPAGRFLSIEAWTGHGDFEDSDGDLRTKTSMIHLSSGATRHHAATYSFAPA